MEALWNLSGYYGVASNHNNTASFQAFVKICAEGTRLFLGLFWLPSLLLAPSPLPWGRTAASSSQLATMCQQPTTMWPVRVIHCHAICRIHSHPIVAIRLFEAVSPPSPAHVPALNWQQYRQRLPLFPHILPSRSKPNQRAYENQYIICLGQW